MQLNIKDDINLRIVGEVTVRELFDDGTSKIKRFDKNIVVYDGILLMMGLFAENEDSGGLSGITHLAFGDGKPQFIDEVTESDKKNFIYGMHKLGNELYRVVKWEHKYYKQDEFGNLDLSGEPTNIVEFSFRLRKNDPEELVYISEIGMFGGDVAVTNVPLAKMILDNNGDISDGTKGVQKSQVKKAGSMFSYKYYDPPIDKHPETILEFVWRINFLRG